MKKIFRNFFIHSRQENLTLQSEDDNGRLSIPPRGTADFSPGGSIIIFLIAGILFYSPCVEASSFVRFKAIEILTGFAKSELKRESDSSMVPFIFAFDFDIKPTLERFGISPPSLVELQLEPSVCYIYEPRPNVETNGTFALKLGLLPEDFKFQPYLKLGAGISFMSQHVREQATQFNFLEYYGAGVHYFLNKNLAVTLDCRYRHLSNCGTKSPNHGINSLFFVVGSTYKF